MTAFVTFIAVPLVFWWVIELWFVVVRNRAQPDPLPRRHVHLTPAQRHEIDDAVDAWFQHPAEPRPGEEERT